MDTFQKALARLTTVAVYDAKLSHRSNGFGKYINDINFRNSEIEIALKAEWARQRLNHIFNKAPLK